MSQRPFSWRRHPARVKINRQSLELSHVDRGITRHRDIGGDGVAQTSRWTARRARLRKLRALAVDSVSRRLRSKYAAVPPAGRSPTHKMPAMELHADSLSPLRRPGAGPFCSPDRDQGWRDLYVDTSGIGFCSGGPVASSKQRVRYGDTVINYFKRTQHCWPQQTWLAARLRGGSKLRRTINWNHRTQFIRPPGLLLVDRVTLRKA